MDDHVCACDQSPRCDRVAHVAPQLLDRALEAVVVERRQVERAHIDAVGEQAPCEVQAQEARAA